MSAALKNLPRYLLVIAVCYFVAWTAAYVVINGTDFDVYFQYLAYFWGGSGGERPSFTGGLSIAITIPLFVAVLWLRRRAPWRRKRD